MPEHFGGADFVAVGAGEDAGDVVKDGAVEIGIVTRGSDGATVASGTGHCRRGISMGRIHWPGHSRAAATITDSSSRTLPGQV